MDSLQSLLPAVLRKRGLKDQADASLLRHRVQLWIEEQMPHCSASIQVTSFKHGELSIECADSIAAQECQVRLEMLKTYLDEQTDIPHPASFRLLRS